MSVTRRVFGVTREGVEVESWTLRNANGLEAEVLSYGATLAALRMPDRAGTLGDVVLGFDTLADYEGEHPYLGAIVGRYGNRIAGGRFELNGETYTLARNDGPNHLHGGPQGFHRRVWQAKASGEDTVELRRTSADGEEGYPGTLDVVMRYSLSPADELQIEYHARCDADTVINLTNHAYFNLDGGATILDHELQIFGSRFVPIDATSIPLGDLRPVEDSPFDFREPHAIGARIAADDQQLRHGQGYDHSWVLDKPAGELGPAARVSSPASGRVIEVHTTQPAVQFYSGNMLTGELVGRHGQRYVKRSGLCLETQHLPDSPNQPEFPSTVLRAGDEYRHITVLRCVVDP